MAVVLAFQVVESCDTYMYIRVVAKYFLLCIYVHCMTAKWIHVYTTGNENTLLAVVSQSLRTTYPGLMAAGGIPVVREWVCVWGREVGKVKQQRTTQHVKKHKVHQVRNNGRQTPVCYNDLPGGAIPGRMGPVIPGIIMGGPMPGMTGCVYIIPIPPSIRSFLVDGSPSPADLPPPIKRRGMSKQGVQWGSEGVVRRCVDTCRFPQDKLHVYMHAPHKNAVVWYFSLGSRPCLHVHTCNIFVAVATTVHTSQCTCTLALVTHTHTHGRQAIC